MAKFKIFKSAAQKTQPTTRPPKSGEKGAGRKMTWDDRMAKSRKYRQAKREEIHNYKLAKRAQDLHMSEQQIQEAGKTQRTVARWSNVSSMVAPYLGQQGTAAVESAKQNINGGLTSTGNNRDDEEGTDGSSGTITFPGAK